MNHVLAVISTLLMVGAQADALRRGSHDDSIYIVRGSREQLANFDRDVGSKWEGGKLLTRDQEHGVYRYWAFPDRTAPQAREFIFGAMSSGLSLDMIAYDERLAFRAERSMLDDIAISCRLSDDPFFITPVGELKISFDAAEPVDAVGCVKMKLEASPLKKMIKASAN